MAEYHKMMHMDEVEPDALDEYLSINEEDRINELDIIHLFGKEKLETIQESLSKATGLAFITVDFKGDPITSATSFSRYWKRSGTIRWQWNGANHPMRSDPSRQRLHRKQTYTSAHADFWRLRYQLSCAVIIWAGLSAVRSNVMTHPIR